MVTITKRRQVVTHLTAAFEVSARRACELVRLSRARWHYKPLRPERDGPVRDRLKALASERPRFGYKRLAVLLRREGMVINHKRVLRLYREERLAVRPHRGKKRAAVARVPLDPPRRPNERWGLDFIHDRCEDGRQIRCLCMVDEFTRECPAIEIDTSLPAARVVAVLDRVAVERGALPETIIVDNGPEFVSQALDIWAYRRGIELHFIRPGKPVENAYVESFHSRFRDECLNTHWFLDVADARFQIERWRRDYNEVRPHSSLNNQTPEEFARSFTEVKTLNRLSA